METYSFAIHVKAVDLTGQYEDLFWPACDDATIVVVDGRLRLDFDREEASSYKVASAMDDVERAGARVAFVESLESL